SHNLTCNEVSLICDTCNILSFLASSPLEHYSVEVSESSLVDVALCISCC
ncbi:hypothetical protein MTR67_030614, partial [Solanum verrucosum]